MILVGNQRGGAKDLAVHLMKEENDHVTLHELRGFAADDLKGALTEAYAISRATKCRQFLFSLSLNPPPDARVPTEAFEAAIDRIETKLGLEGQPRAIVFHEKEGRRHAHAVWSRIDIEAMKAVQLSHSKVKLRDVSRELYREHGWRMPNGLADQSLSDPRNFTLDQWQQAKRNGVDPRDIKTAIQDAWAISDSKGALVHALKERGYYLARGDRRGFVVLDYRGEVYALPKWAGVKTKEVRTRLGDEASLPSVYQTKAVIAADMLRKVHDLREDIRRKHETERAAFQTRKTELVQRQKSERAALAKTQKARQVKEHQLRQSRFRKGLAGLWDRLRGEHRRMQKLNEQELATCKTRDRTERDALIFDHLDQRRTLVAQRAIERNQDRSALQDLRADRKTYEDLYRTVTGRDCPDLSKTFTRASGPTHRAIAGKDKARDGPALER